MKQDTLDFLKSVFPNEPDTNIQLLFGDLFDDDRMGRDKSKPERQADLAGYEQALQQLIELPDSANGFEIRKVCKDLPSKVKSFMGTDDDGLSLVDAIARLKLYRDQSEIWKKHHPRHGGRNENANILAESIAYIFVELDEPVTAGTKSMSEVQPSTNFGRVVKYAINYHGIGSNWLSPHKRVADKLKNGWRP